MTCVLFETIQIGIGLGLLALFGYVAYALNRFCTIWFDPKVGFLLRRSLIKWDEETKMHTASIQIFVQSPNGIAQVDFVDDPLEKLPLEVAYECLAPDMNNWIKGKGVYVGGENGRDSQLVFEKERNNFFHCVVYFDLQKNIKPIREYIRLMRQMEEHFHGGFRASYLHPWTNERVFFGENSIFENYAQMLEIDLDILLMEK